MTDKEKGRATNRGTAKENNQFSRDDTSNDPLTGWYRLAEPLRENLKRQKRSNDRRARK